MATTITRFSRRKAQRITKFIPKSAQAQRSSGSPKKFEAQAQELSNYVPYKSDGLADFTSQMDSLATIQLLQSAAAPCTLLDYAAPPRYEEALNRRASRRVNEESDTALLNRGTSEI